MTQRKLILILLLLIPAGWAGLVQFLVRRSPPGAAITVPMGDILAAMDQIPEVDPKDPEYQLRYHLTQGETWTYDIVATTSSRGQDLQKIIGKRHDSTEDEGEIKSGTYLVTVMSENSGSWRLKIVATKGGNLKNPFFIQLNRHGNMTLPQDTTAVMDARDELFRRTGIYIPGPFKEKLRPRDWCGEMPGTTFGLRTRNIVQRLALKTGKDRMPPRGGLMFYGPSPVSRKEIDFKILSYRRKPLDRDAWEGYVELLIRADYHCDRDAIHLANGLARLRDIIDMQENKTIGAAAEYDMVIRQVARPSGK